MITPDVRWKQRLQNLQRAFTSLKDGVTLANTKSLSELEKQGLIQSFEFTHELAWNVMKDYFEFQGATLITGSRDAAKEAFQKGLVKNGEVWMEMIISRNKTSHTYNQNVADEILQKILTSYFQEIDEFIKTMQKMSRP